MKSIVETLEALYAHKEEEIERWLSSQRALAAPYLYNSVDLRHSGVRLLPVDTNLYPAGFNNLSLAGEDRATRYLQRYFQERLPQCNRVLLVPESHTRNLAYLDNLRVLARMLERVGLEVRIGSLDVREERRLPTLSGAELTQFPLKREGALLGTEDGFVPDAVVLNNDCTGGIPDVLQGISQPIAPPPEMGWHTRRKSMHFGIYEKLAREFAEAFGLDVWRISALFHACGRIDFKQQHGLDCLAQAVDDVLARARVKHAEYGIAEDPYVFVKADGGTYGMGIMTVRSGSEMLELNKKERNKMQVVKEGARVSEVIIQEGVPTIDRVDGKPAEPMVYLIDGVPAGGMFRVNGARDAYGNLNAAGVEFTGMCDETEAGQSAHQPVRPCHFRAYGLIAAMAALAVPREAEQMKQAAGENAA